MSIGSSLLAESSLSRALEIENFDKVEQLLSYPAYDKGDLKDALYIAREKRESCLSILSKPGFFSQVMPFYILCVLGFVGLADQLDNYIVHSKYGIPTPIDNMAFNPLTTLLSGAAFLYGAKRTYEAVRRPSKNEIEQVKEKITRLDVIIKKLVELL